MNKTTHTIVIPCILVLMGIWLLCFSKCTITPEPTKSWYEDYVYGITLIPTYKIRCITS